MRTARVTVVVLCVFICINVCVSVRSFPPPHASRPRQIGMYVFNKTQEKISLKMLRSEAIASFACLECH